MSKVKAPVFCGSPSCKWIEDLICPKEFLLAQISTAAGWSKKISDELKNQSIEFSSFSIRWQRKSSFPIVFPLNATKKRKDEVYWFFVRFRWQQLQKNIDKDRIHTYMQITMMRNNSNKKPSIKTMMEETDQWEEECEEKSINDINIMNLTSDAWSEQTVLLDARHQLSKVSLERTNILILISQKKDHRIFSFNLSLIIQKNKRAKEIRWISATVNAHIDDDAVHCLWP